MLIKYYCWQSKYLWMKLSYTLHEISAKWSELHTNLQPYLIYCIKKENIFASGKKNILFQYFNTEINYHTYPPTQSLSISQQIVRMRLVWWSLLSKFWNTLYYISKFKSGPLISYFLFTVLWYLWNELVQYIMEVPFKRQIPYIFGFVIPIPWHSII